MKKICILACILMLCLRYENVHAQSQENASVSTSLATQKMDFVRLHPITMMDVGIGVGAGYERLFGRNKNFGLILPGFVILEGNANANSDSNSNRKSYDAYFYFAPGFKYYPMGHNKLTYALGTSLMFGFCNSKFQITSANAYAGSEPITVKYARKRFGVLINNYVTYEISRLFDLGIEGGIGMTYYNRESYDGPESYAGSGISQNKGVDLCGQFSFSIGYKF